MEREARRRTGLVLTGSPLRPASPRPRTPHAGVQRLYNAIRRGAGILVLPDAHDCPSGLGETPVGISIALAIPLDLRAPPLGIRRRPRHVQRAAMPEAAIDEDCYPRPAEHQVGPPT